METRLCPRCNGSKVQDYLGETRACNNCKATGSFEGFDAAAIKAAIVCKRGARKGQILASMTSPYRGTVEQNRAYYVWRMARFHGSRDSKDLCQPFAADMVLGRDPFVKELDKLADEVAIEHFGTDKAAAIVWGRAMGLL